MPIRKLNSTIRERRNTKRCKIKGGRKEMIKETITIRREEMEIKIEERTMTSEETTKEATETNPEDSTSR